ncbi:hypothetical protein [Streptomyces tauricus]|nr:hypothetical protein [Streptomyces tauricus]MCW8103438.1 hypothetical protein [Streptomyces tauricus]
MIQRLMTAAAMVAAAFSSFALATTPTTASTHARISCCAVHEQVFAQYNA